MERRLTSPSRSPVNDWSKIRRTLSGSASYGEAASGSDAASAAAAADSVLAAGDAVGAAPAGAAGCPEHAASKSGQNADRRTRDHAIDAQSFETAGRRR